MASLNETLEQQKEDLERQLKKQLADLEKNKAIIRDLQTENYILKTDLEAAKVEQIKQIAKEKGLSYAQASYYYTGYKNESSW